MTVKRKRSKSYADAEEAALRAGERSNKFFQALRAVLENNVTWIEAVIGRAKVRAGVAFANAPCGGIVLFVQQFPTNTVYDVYEGDAFVDAFTKYWGCGYGLSEEARAMRNLAHDVALLRNRMIDEAEDPT